MEQMPPVSPSHPAAASGESGGDSWVHADDLIDDRALHDIKKDAFRLGDVVEEVGELCASTPTPATVALYGSWGSGKSSLGNLLKAKFKPQKKIAFAQFDAFKYAEVPLRRHFLSQVATEFEVRDKKFHEDLYADHKEVGIKIPPSKWLSLLLVVAVAVVITTLLAALAAAVIAVLSKGGFHANFTRTLRTSLPGIAIATPLLAAAIGLVGQYLTADTTTKAPSSEEEFERLFKCLVKEVKKRKHCERLVVFIDELDRCSPRQVVSALETLRTFLEVPSCIFVVAADQQVLEHALTGAARQVTPFNPANPYYSAGSAYLDKIFQYQLQLPPVLPRRLSRYALDLIKDRQGVWAKVANRPELVSVLVPTHVTSPRRVKALLNSFALLYRLALRRASEKAIDEKIEGRVSEIAKLACFRTEFPLFAADLQLEARLPAIVLHIRKHPSAPDADLKSEFRGVSDEALGRAHAYAEGRLPVDEVIAREPRGAAPRASTPSVVPTTPAAVAPATQAAVPDEEEDEETAVEQVEASQARQLLRYLERTQRIPNPGRDLVYLESLGAAFGLPSEFAEQIERDAIDGRRDPVVEAVEQLPDEEEQLKAYRLMAWLVREAVGIESQNVVGSLFGAMAVARGELDPVADDLLNSLVTYSTGYDLEADDLLPALRLALTRSGAAARQMRTTVLDRDELLTDDDLAVFAFEHLAEFPSRRGRLAEALASMLERGSGAEAERALRDSSETDTAQFVDRAELEEDAYTGLASFVESAKQNSRETVASRAFKRLLDSDTAEAAAAARTVVGLFAPITDEALAPAIVKRALARPVAEWPDWLAAVDATVVGQSEGMAETIDGGVEQLWSERFGAPLEHDSFVAVAHELGRLRPEPAEDDELLDLLSGAAVVNAPPALPARLEQFDELRALADAGAVSPEEAATSILGDLGRTLSAPQGASYPAPLSEHVRTSGAWALPHVRDDAIEQFLSAVEDCGWLDATARDILRVRGLSALRRLSEDAAAPTAASLSVLVANESSETDEALADWITTFVPEPTRVVETLAPRLTQGQRPAEPLRRAIATAAQHWSPEQKADLLRAVVDQFRDGNLHEGILRAAAIADADADKAGASIVEAYESSRNNDQRRRVMELWGLVNPAPDRVRRLLINKIYIPLLNEGKGATSIALDHFSLVRNPPSQNVQQRLKTVMRKAVEDDKGLAKRTDKLWQDAGWAKRKKRWPF